MSGKMVCPRCSGNGYRRIWKDADEKEKITIQCAKCNSEGEIDITEEEINALLDKQPGKLQ